MTKTSLIPATTQDGSYPRPQLMRPHWRTLDGPWEFGFGTDPGDPVSAARFDRTILVPYPPESPASGIGEPGFHPVLWYRRTFDTGDLENAGIVTDTDRVVLHFGAVDWAADVWLNGAHLGRHEGGQSPFSFDITQFLDRAGTNTLVVRAVDDPHDVSIPRGKQDWQEVPHAIWYHRTSGIWQPVWIEAVAATHVTSLSWDADAAAGTVRVELELSGAPASGTSADVELLFAGELLAAARMQILDRRARLHLDVPRLRNGQAYEDLLWSPEHPHLVDATITILEGGATVDRVASYLGVRSVAARDRQFLLNDRPRYLRLVLAQNYWPDSHLAAPNADALRREAELIKALGFDGARVHQKAEDPRFLYWADRLGLLIWAETANAYEFTDRSVTALTTEWMSLVRRDRSHPSIVAWVPINESWGVPHIAHDGRQRAYSRALADLTRALDPTRPVISNDGWEHTSSDIWTIHDYDDAPTIASRYQSTETTTAILQGFGPVGRRLSCGQQHHEQPIMLTEFGGISYVDRAIDGAWGYRSAKGSSDLLAQVAALVDAVGAGPVLVGFCYTQLTDTGQETNGLLRADRTPKAPMDRLRAAIVGERDADTG